MPPPSQGRRKGPNPVEMTKPFSIQAPVRPTLTKREARRLLRGTSGRRQCMWASAIHLGLRKGELFALRRGGLMHRDYKLPRRLRADLRRAGVETSPRFRGHDLRHTFATLATEAGVASDVVRMTLGHAGGVTASYQHLSLEARRRELSRLSIVGCRPIQERSHAMRA